MVEPSPFLKMAPNRKCYITRYEKHFQTTAKRYRKQIKFITKILSKPLMKSTKPMLLAVLFTYFNRKVINQK